MTSSLLIAAALSIASTNDYLFTRSLIPSNTVLVGYGVGTSGSNRLVRAEDVCFLREALAERYVAVKGPTYTNVPHARVPLFVHMPTNSFYSALDYAPESFDAEEWFYSRGETASFVDPSFLLIGGTFPCTTNWTVHITGITHPDQDVRRSYLPFLSAETRRMTFDPSVTNNAAYGILNVALVTNAYAFVQKLGSVTVEPQDYCGTALYPRSTTLIDAKKTDTIWNHQYNKIEKTYQTPHGPITYEVPTSIASSTSTTTENTELYEQMPWPLWKTQRIAELTVGVPWSAVCPRWFEGGTGVADVTAYGSARDAYHDWSITMRFPQSGNIHVFGRYPSDLPKGLEATAGWLVCGWRWSVTDTKTISNPFSPESTETEILENACCVVVFRFWPLATSAATGRGMDRFVWDTRLTPTSIRGDAVRVLGVDFKYDEEPDELVPRDIPQTAVVSSVVQSGTATGTHRIDRKLECEWVNVVLVFSHTFNATFDDD